MCTPLFITAVVEPLINFGDLAISDILICRQKWPSKDWRIAYTISVSCCQFLLPIGFVVSERDRHLGQARPSWGPQKGLDMRIRLSLIHI